MLFLENDTFFDPREKYIDQTTSFALCIHPFYFSTTLLSKNKQTFVIEALFSERNKNQGKRFGSVMFCTQSYSVTCHGILCTFTL